VVEAVRQTGIGRSTIFTYIRMGLLKRYKRRLDRRTYVDLDELEELKRNPPFVP
jgi:DNA-binding transcriptional MerR regulator